MSKNGHNPYYYAKKITLGERNAGKPKRLASVDFETGANHKPTHHKYSNLRERHLQDRQDEPATVKLPEISQSMKNPDHQTLTAKAKSSSVGCIVKNHRDNAQSMAEKQKQPQLGMIGFSQEHGTVTAVARQGILSYKDKISKRRIII